MARSPTILEPGKKSANTGKKPRILRPKIDNETNLRVRKIDNGFVVTEVRFKKNGGIDETEHFSPTRPQIQIELP